MNRPAAQTILCLILCPLLTAQQASQPPTPPSQPAPAERYITLPIDTNIELLPPGTTKFAHQKPGALVQFVLDRDLSLDGKPIFHATVPVVGVVDSAKRASRFKHRPAEMNIRITEIIAGQPTQLHLRCFDPDTDSAGPVNSYDDPPPGFNPIKAALVTVGALLLLALVFGKQ